MDQQQSRRLGALSGKWNVPPPRQLKALLKSDPELEDAFYEGDLGFPAGDDGEEAGGSREANREHLPGAQFEVFSDAEGGLRWRLRQNESGRVLAESAASYPSRARCREAIGQMRSLGLRAQVKEGS